MTTPSFGVPTNTGHLPFGESGQGNYGANLGQLNGRYTSLFETDYLFNLIREIPFPDTTCVFNIGDYGTADGAAAMTSIRRLLLWLKDLHGDQVQFQVIYEDRDVNDFNSLFRRLSGLLPHPPTYLWDLTNVYPLVSGNNFYKQCVPSDSMHIILCMAAVHWLSGNPPVYKDAIYCFPGTDSETERTVQTQSADDWEQFLLMRSRELKTGGLLVVSAPSDNPDPSGNHRLLSNKHFLHLLNDTWKMFRDTGKITQSEFTNTNLALFQRSLAIYTAPFQNNDSPVSKTGLRLLSAKVVVLPCKVYQAWKHRKEQKDTKSKDKKGEEVKKGEEKEKGKEKEKEQDITKEYARRFVSAHRCWSNSAFTTALSGSRTDEERNAIVESLYATVEEKVGAMNPDEIQNDYRFAFVFIRKD